MNERKILKWLILAILVLYVVSPADLLPGPVDDLIAILLYLAGNKRDLIGKKNDDANVVDVDSKDI